MGDMINPIKGMRKDLGDIFYSKSSLFLTSFLILLACAILYIALFQKDRTLKIVTLLWVLLP